MDNSQRIGQSSYQANNPASNRKPAESSDVHAFSKAMETPAANTSQEEMLSELIELLQQLIEIIAKGNKAISGDSGSSTHGGSTSAGDGGVTPVNGSGAGGSAGSDELIPEPTEHKQTLNLGGKQVVVGGDGTASAAEVQATASSIENMYQNSPTFRDMIDNSSDPDFEVSVGRRSDNTSWGNTGGKVFMNINNINPGNSDTFQSLLAHEFGHASIDLGHGHELEHIEETAAREA